MSNKKVIEPQLFEIATEYDTKYHTYYVIAYDTVHAITSVLEECKTEKNIISVKNLTGIFLRSLLVSKECLPQRLVNKTIQNG